jgi:tRNA pseudouridine55 synthase
MIAMDGVLVIDKPAGMTSHDVVARTRRILHERRIGHTGTLDPFATGVLVVLLGKATRLSQFLTGVDKEYEAIIRLGYSTDTGDRTGNPLPGPAAVRNWTEA